MTTAVSPPPSAMADVRYLWSEVDRLKAQVHELQHAERRTTSEQQRVSDYVASFVTQAQLDAALCTRTSQASVASSIEHVRDELLGALDAKADVDTLRTLNTTKLDVSVYEARAWDVIRLRTALEQNVRDLFASFARQIEDQVRAKLSIADFDRIFNPEADGHKAALETATATLARMNDELQTLQEYVASDCQRQQRVAELGASLLDLTRQLHATRTAGTQLSIAHDATAKRVQELEENSRAMDEQQHELQARVLDHAGRVRDLAQAQRQEQERAQQAHTAIQSVVEEHSGVLVQVQRALNKTLPEAIARESKQVREPLERAVDELKRAQHQHRTQSAQQARHTSDTYEQLRDQDAALIAQLARVESAVAVVKSELAECRGPLLTTAINLREENVAILGEIHRSQDESRELLLNYRSLLIEHNSVTTKTAVVPATVTPMRPGSSPSPSPLNTSSSATSRRHKQQQVLAMTARIGQTTNRPGKLQSPRGTSKTKSNNDDDSGGGRDDSGDGNGDREKSSGASTPDSSASSRLLHPSRGLPSRRRARTAGVSNKSHVNNTRRHANNGDQGARPVVPPLPLPQRPRSEAGVRRASQHVFPVAAMTAQTGFDDPTQVGGDQLSPPWADADWVDDRTDETIDNNLFVFPSST